MSIPVLYVADSDERVKIIDSEDQEFYLPKTFEVRAEPISKKSSTLDVAYSHGAMDVSDGMFGQRIVEVSGKIWADNDADYNTAWDALAEHLIKENFRIQIRNRQIYIKKLTNLSHAYPSTVWYPYGVVDLEFLATDPFWYSKDERTKSIVINASSVEFTWGIGGKIEVHPIISIRNYASNTNFTLRNITDTNREFRITDSSALEGTTIEVDCVEGTVKRDGIDIISSFSKMFLRLLGGQWNRFRYTGADCLISMAYREAWL